MTDNPETDPRLQRFPPENLDAHQAIIHQLELFTPESIRARKVMLFDPQTALARLQAQDGRLVLAADLGGDKIEAAIFQAQAGSVINSQKDTEHFLENLSRLQSESGFAYLTRLSGLAIIARQNEFPVGISTAGLVHGTSLQESPNLPTFMALLKGLKSGDFKNIFPYHSLFVQNDAVAGIMAAAVEAQRRGMPTKYLLYLINGGGVGLAVLYEGQIIATEAGHVPIDPELNSFGQKEPCLFTPRDTHVCIEKVAGSGAGIESIWKQFTRQPLSGREISKLYGRDQRATTLYQDSARLAALTVSGVAKALDIPLNPDEFTVAAHGGCFKSSFYPDLFEQYLSELFGFQPHLIFTRDFSENACLQGAATGAFLQ